MRFQYFAVTHEVIQELKRHVTFYSKKMTNIESNEKLVIKKKKTTQQNRWGMSNSTLPFYHYGHITEVHQLSTKSFLCTSTRLTPPGFFLKSVLNAFLR